MTQNLVRISVMFFLTVFRNQWKCVCRHIVFPKFDHRPEFDWVPDEGEVKVSDSTFSSPEPKAHR